jgi:hypothetical protein
MVVQFIRLAGKFTGSKFLLLPAIGIAFVSVAALSLTYTTSRKITSKIIGAGRFEESSTICQTTSSGIAAIPTLSYIIYRHYKYEPQSLDAITAVIEEQARQEGLLNKPAATSSSKQQRLDIQDLYYRLNRNRQVWQQYIAQPLRFYSINFLIGAAIMGSSTAIAQRIVCGKTKNSSTVNKEKANGVTAT